MDLKDSKYEQPSFAAARPYGSPASTPRAVKVAREKLLEMTQTLHDAVLGPEESLNLPLSLGLMMGLGLMYMGPLLRR
jgi:hypothetical protein